jgi:CRP-like cAMP-binding protein
MRGGPAQWPGMAGTALIVAASLLWFLRAEQGQRQFKLTAEQMMLFARLPGLTPGQFKSLLDLASWSEPQTALQLTEEGKQPAALHYILEGKVDVNKKGKVFPLGPHAFVGELAFLRNKPATATVHARPGSLVVSWPADRLQALFQSDSGIRQAMSALLSADLAEKIARSDVPLLQEQSGGK